MATGVEDETEQIRTPNNVVIFYRQDAMQAPATPEQTMAPAAVPHSGACSEARAQRWLQ